MQNSKCKIRAKGQGYRDAMLCIAIHERRSILAIRQFMAKSIHLKYCRGRHMGVSFLCTKGQFIMKSIHGEARFIIFSLYPHRHQTSLSEQPFPAIPNSEFRIPNSPRFAHAARALTLAHSSAKVSKAPFLLTSGDAL